MKGKTLKLMGENIQQYLCDFVVGKNLLKISKS